MDARQKIKEAMVEQRWSVRSLAKKAGLTRPSVIKALEGVPVLGRTAEKIAAVLFEAKERPAMIAAMATARKEEQAR